MQSSSITKALILHYEALRLAAYLCPSGKPTIGWGSTRGVELGMTITEEEARMRLLEDIESVDQFIGRHVRAELHQHEYDALASFVFNVKRSKFLDSTMLRQLNEGMKSLAAVEFPRWIYGSTPTRGKVVLPGLVKRRKSERLLFKTGKLVLY